MIRKMRYRFIAFMLFITAILLTSILIILYQTRKIFYEQQSMDILQEAIHMEESREKFMRKERGWKNKNPFADLLIADKKKDGRIQIVVNEIYGIEDAAVGALIAQVQTAQDKIVKEKTGVLEEQNLRYLFAARGPNGTIRYVFANIDAERYSLHEQLEMSVVIWISAFAAFWLVSIWLSRWAVRPVETVWEQQRQFVADASHELKTPLTVILSNANMLALDSEHGNETSHQRIVHIQAEAEYMSRLIQGLLTLAKQDAMTSSSTMQYDKVDFSYLVNYTVSEFEPVIYEMEKTVDSMIADEVYVYGDEKKLFQLVQILLDNANKYSNTNSVIEVSLSKNLNGKNKEMMLHVTSRGTPLTKEELSCVFHRFYRTAASRSHVEGHGLGLSIAYEIVKEHRGKIWAESFSDGRNRFTVQFPLSC